MTEYVNWRQIGFGLILDSNIAPGDGWFLFNLGLKVNHYYFMFCEINLLKVVITKTFTFLPFQIINCK